MVWRQMLGLIPSSINYCKFLGKLLIQFSYLQNKGITIALSLSSYEMIHINNTFGTLFALQSKLSKCYLLIWCCISLNAHNSSEITRKWSDSGKVILLSRNGEEPALKSRLFLLHNTASQCQSNDSQPVNHTATLEIVYIEKHTQKPHTEKPASL